MADNGDDSGSSRTITAAETPSSSAADSTQPEDAALPLPADRGGDAEGTEDGTDEHSVQRGNSSDGMSGGHEVHHEEVQRDDEEAQAGSDTQLVDFLHTCPEEQSILVGTDFTSLGPDMSTTTIIYVQPDGSLVEGSGLTPEEQRSLLEQLTKQQVVQVSDSEAAQLLQQSQAVKGSPPVHNAALNPSQLQQVISQVTKSQQVVQTPQQMVKQVVQVQASPQNLSQQVVQTPQQTVKQVVQVQTSPQNLSQQTVKQVVQVQTSPQNLSQQVVQTVKQVVHVQTGPQNPPQLVKTVVQQVAAQSGGSVQKKSEPVRIQVQAPPKQEVKVSTNGSAQIFHIQPMVGQQGQQLFLQQNLGDPPIQLLLQSPGSLLPLVHKLPAQTSSAAVAAVPHKHVSSPAKTPPKTPPSPTAKFSSVSLIKTPANSTVATPVKSPIGPAKTGNPVPAQNVVAPPPAAKDGEKEKVKKSKKRDKKAVKVQTRSGRVSRPPKYKAKDYKFIKTEDLAESHQSDSDDYSDMSMEEEERKDNSAPDDAMSLTYGHKSRSHRCQTCDKAYIGPGGLNRHYKLNPSHGEPSCDAPHPLSDEERSPGPAEEEPGEEKAVAVTTSRDPLASGGFRGLHHRGVGRPRGRGRGRGRGRPLGPPPKFPQVSGGLIRRGGRRGRPPKLSVAMATAEQQVERRRERLQELVEQCEDEELMDIVLPRLTKVLSVWEMLLAKVERGGPARSYFPDIYREFESLQAQVRQAAQDYIVAPVGGATPLEIRNIEVARCLGILDEVNRMKVLPGASPSPSVSNKNSRYLENSKMLPPSKRFKMENSAPLHHNGVSPVTPPPTVVTAPPAVTPPPSVLSPPPASTPTPSVVSTPPVVTSPPPVVTSPPPAVTPPPSVVAAPAALTPPLPPPHDSSCSTGPKQAPPPATPMEVTTGENEEAPPTEEADKSAWTVQNVSQTASEDPTESCQTKELEEGEEIYIQTEGMTVQLAEPGQEGIVIVNGPDGTTMHIQTPEGVPLEAVQALLGIEGSKST
ncbi:zinc finger protein 839 isoform X2 [Entelurus aequoreus]|uniref:zinc finger protein 839 isoform X2 n=1 Tax=Entelurus aequoreus TaxID=161455 RepID=UPI002B1DF087|nr:zinc finger protein 839 isoform X2 [Entelurus aequoreus]